ncbi:MAG: ATP synthase F0 subunit B [Lachnospiraceae bacterium]|nr:ATP synthase F0 subunit B [Lachnospiraceae bacterium]MBO5145766.1 ATP synthase F0 subunit B [Lachnospiraceae bacterium]
MLRLDINLVFTIINLLIIYFIVAKFLIKPIKNILAKRQEEIDKQYADARTAEDKALELKQQYEDSVKGIADEKAAAVNEARAKAGQEYDRIVADAKAEADKLVDNARKLARQEQEKSVKQAQEQIADLVVEAAARVVASGQGSTADRELYNQFLAKTGEQQ